MARYYIIPTNGPKLEIDGTDFLKLKRRFKTATSGAWEVEGEKSTGAVVQLQNIIAIVPELTAEEAKTAADEKKKAIETERKRKLATHPELVKPKKEFDHCKFSHAVDPAKGKYADNVVVRKETTSAGVIRYFPVCAECGWRGQLIKAQTIPKAFGIQPEQVEDYVAPEEG